MSLNNPDAVTHLEQQCHVLIYLSALNLFLNVATISVAMLVALY